MKKNRREPDRAGPIGAETQTARRAAMAEVDGEGDDGRGRL